MAKSQIIRPATTRSAIDALPQTDAEACPNCGHVVMPRWTLTQRGEAYLEQRSGCRTFRMQVEDMIKAHQS